MSLKVRTMEPRLTGKHLEYQWSKGYSNPKITIGGAFTNAPRCFRQPIWRASSPRNGRRASSGLQSPRPAAPTREQA